MLHNAVLPHALECVPPARISTPRVLPAICTFKTDFTFAVRTGVLKSADLHSFIFKFWPSSNGINCWVDFLIGAWKTKRVTSHFEQELR